MTVRNTGRYLDTFLEKQDNDTPDAKSLFIRVSGRFYTDEIVAERLAVDVIRRLCLDGKDEISIIEPFSGDGRLIVRFLKEIARQRGADDRLYRIELWDCDEIALVRAKYNVLSAAQSLGLEVTVDSRPGNTFLIAQENVDLFDVCITNPPWETLKPDRREMAHLTPQAKQEHILLLQNYDRHLADLYPLSTPQRKYSGWGTNLARCGAELALRLLSSAGVCGLVAPSTLFADQLSERLRHWILRDFVVSNITFYPAELRLFSNVDQSFVTFVASSGDGKSTPPQITSFLPNGERSVVSLAAADWRHIIEAGQPVPFHNANDVSDLDTMLTELPTFQEWGGENLWTGRELDETDHQSFLSPKGEYLFLKGRMVGRYGLLAEPTHYVSADGPRIPKTADKDRIVWRDVARTTQKRRMQATIIPAGWVTGNSLNVACLQDTGEIELKVLLALMNSLMFEVQVRSKSATGHVSVGTVRRIHLPVIPDAVEKMHLANMVDQITSGIIGAEARLEIRIARLYGISHDGFQKILSRFPKLSDDEVKELLENPEWKQSASIHDKKRSPQIPNHYSASLSALDLVMAEAVPPGGNWKNIPDSAPSQRVRQIKQSYTEGGGSRSTYYGRLAPDEPSYTINTHFCRPGNGCHLHYDYGGGQHRVLSQREAARLQSFPDDFIFTGSRNAVNQQIGNAVPPLLAYQVARSLPYRGRFLDLFAGAGGLALGFLWAGWEPVVANDIIPSYLETYGKNIHDTTVCGDIRDEAVFQAILDGSAAARLDPDVPLFVLGGPPCQGFSTAGNKRSMEDERNWLFRSYRAVLDAVRPSGFLFENVTGLMNMDQGRVFRMVQEELRSASRALSVWRLNAEEYGIPQRRTRIILFGDNLSNTPLSLPPVVTSHTGKRRRVAQETLFGAGPVVCGVRDALDDLPALRPGEDGSKKSYVSEPSHPYQMLMRGRITAEEYLMGLG